MFGLETLDILIGLVTIYLAFAVACTACVEVISAFFQFRSKNLHDALSELLSGDISEDEKFVTAFYNHPLVQTLSKGGSRGPSYIPSEIVGKVVESLVTLKTGAQTLDDALNALPASRTKDLLKVLFEEAKGGAGDFRKVVEAQFDVTMDRASGWFKRKTQLVTLSVSVVLVVSLNVDTVAIATSLASSPEARSALVKMAEQKLHETEQAQGNANEKGAEDPKALAALESRTVEARNALDDAKMTLEVAALPLGWGSSGASGGVPGDFADATTALTKVFGLLVSIFAISLGAPFWFSVLDRFHAVRTTGVREGTVQHAARAQSQSSGQPQPPTEPPTTT